MYKREMVEFKVGDRVIYNHIKRGVPTLNGKIGTIIGYTNLLFIVEFDDYIGQCNVGINIGKFDHMWGCHSYNLQFYNDNIIIDESEMEKFL